MSNNPGIWPINGTKTFHQSNNGESPAFNPLRHPGEGKNKKDPNNINLHNIFKSCWYNQLNV
jgi:hypothetical protein